jgi:hypothetical protein
MQLAPNLVAFYPYTKQSRKSYLPSSAFEPKCPPTTLHWCQVVHKEPWKVAAMNNATIFAADRTTHVKIVVIALVASITVLLVGISARNTTAAGTSARIQVAGPAVKAGKPVAISRYDATAIR